MTLTISVILPTHDRPRYLRQAVESLLIQSRLSPELIIVSDGEQRIPPACRGTRPTARKSAPPAAYHAPFAGRGHFCATPRYQGSPVQRGDVGIRARRRRGVRFPRRAGMAPVRGPGVEDDSRASPRRAAREVRPRAGVRRQFAAHAATPGRTGRGDACPGRAPLRGHDPAIYRVGNTLVAKKELGLCGRNGHRIAPASRPTHPVRRVRSFMTAAGSALLEKGISRNAKMRILMLMTRLEIGGAEVVALDLTRELRCAGHEVFAAAVYPGVACERTLPRPRRASATDWPPTASTCAPPGACGASFAATRSTPS